MSIIYSLLLCAINLFFAFIYAPTDIDPDIAMYLMDGLLDAKYGKDIVDCKSPLVHLWFRLLSKIWGTVYGIRFLHFQITGLPGIIYTAVTGDIWGGLIFMVLIHAGALYAFHGNVGDIPAGLIFLAIITGNAWVAVSLFVIAVLYEPKLIVAIIPWIFINGYWIYVLPWLGIGLLTALAIWYFKNDWWAWLVEANITIPSRMNKSRKGLYPYMPAFTSNALLYVGMWLTAAVINKPDILYWIPPLCFLILMFAGKVIRANHLLPLVGFIAAAGMDPTFVIAFTVVDLASSGLYLGDIWGRFYPGLRNVIKESREVGAWLENKPGILWVNSMYSEIYIWAKKKPMYGMTEQVEISQVITKRRDRMKTLITREPPTWVVVEPGYGYTFDTDGYKLEAKSVYFRIYKKEQMP